MLPDDLRDYRAPPEPGWLGLIAAGMGVGVAVYLVTVLLLSL